MLGCGLGIAARSVAAVDPRRIGFFLERLVRVTSSFELRSMCEAYRMTVGYPPGLACERDTSPGSLAEGRMTYTSLFEVNFCVRGGLRWPQRSLGERPSIVCRST